MKVIIIGSGVGGLCTGLRLLHAGFEVLLLEKESYVGGVVSGFRSDCGNFKFDRFASIGIHPKEYTRIFNDLQLPYDSYLEPIPLKTLYKVFYSDHSRYVVKKGKPNPDSSYRDFITKTYRRYQIANRSLLTNAFIKASQILSPKIITDCIRLSPWVTANHYIKRMVKNQKLQKFLAFQTFYIGYPPNKLPYLYATIPAVTKMQGLVHIKGGMAAYTQALAKAFEDLGGVIHLNSPVQKILVRHGDAYGVLCKNQVHYANYIVSNADYQYTKRYLLPSVPTQHKKTTNELFHLYFTPWLKYPITHVRSA